MAVQGQMEDAKSFATDKFEAAKTHNAGLNAMATVAAAEAQAQGVTAAAGSAAQSSIFGGALGGVKSLIGGMDFGGGGGGDGAFGIGAAAAGGGLDWSDSNLRTRFAGDAMNSFIPLGSLTFRS